MGGTLQGTYVLTASGRCLGRINSGNPEAVANMLSQALLEWRDLPAKEREAAASIPAATHRWEQSRPQRGLILQRFARDIGKQPSEPPRGPVNRDSVWFTQREVTDWIPDNPTSGQKGTVAPLVARRLAQFALVDNVRGQTLPFAAAEIQRAALYYEVRAVNDERLEFALRGATHAEASGPWLGGDNYWKPKREWPRWLSTSLIGHAVFDRRERRFTEFELVSLGTRFGRTQFNGRAREEPQSQHRIGFVLQLAPPEFRVAPTFINVYDTDWVRHPGK
ncbi:MAG: hypothetical protein NXI31_07535 [bacterium]|nr:hypothetical protein [bacterium]